MLALRPDALTACGRLFAEEIGRWQKQTAKAELVGEAYADILARLRKG